MEYFKDRAAKLKDSAKTNYDKKEFVDELLLLIEDMALMLDDCVDAVDELDERVIELTLEED